MASAKVKIRWRFRVECWNISKMRLTPVAAVSWPKNLENDSSVDVEVLDMMHRLYKESYLDKRIQTCHGPHSARSFEFEGGCHRKLLLVLL